MYNKDNTDTHRDTSYNQQQIATPNISLMRGGNAQFFILKNVDTFPLAVFPLPHFFNPGIFI